jgi:hypothetical protein
VASFVAPSDSMAVSSASGIASALALGK